MADADWTTYEGNRRALPFELRQSGQKGPWDVSGATQIRLEWENPDGTNGTPIIADSGHPQADWANGVVIVVIDNTNITAAIGTYDYTLTVDIGGEIISNQPGTIEVLNRPGA